jgi:hypothetical protein
MAKKRRVPLKGIPTFILFIKMGADMAMKKTIRRYCVFFLLCFLLILSVSPPALGQGGPSDRLDRAAFAEARINRLQQAAKTLHELAAQPLPETLSEDGKTEAMRYTRWLIGSSRKLNDLARRWQDDLKNKGMVQSIVLLQKQMKEMNIAYNSKYSALRNDLLNELRQYASIAHIMKGNYDTAQGSISSLR